MKIRFLLIIATIAAGVLLTQARTIPWANAQDTAQTDQPAMQATPRQPQRGAVDFEKKLWNWLQAVEYSHWGPFPGKTVDFYPGQSPHGALLKIYVNRRVFSNPQDPPTGSIIIKENYNEDKQLLAITIMERAEPGYDPDNKNWYYVKYNPDGTVATADGKEVAGRVQGCIDCHRSAAGNDYLFTNDQ